MTIITQFINVVCNKLSSHAPITVQVSDFYSQTTQDSTKPQHHPKQSYVCRTSILVLKHRLEGTAFHSRNLPGLQVPVCKGKHLLYKYVATFSERINTYFVNCCEHI